GEELDVVDREDVARIRGGEDQRRARAVHRDHRVLERDLLGDQRDHRRLDLELVEVDRRNAVLLRDEVGELALVEIAELRDLGPEAAARDPALLARATQLVGAEEVLPDEKLPDPLVHRWHSPRGTLARETPPRAGPCGLRCARENGREPAGLSAARGAGFT